MLGGKDPGTLLWTPKVVTLGFGDGNTRAIRRLRGIRV